jgi:6-hydroxycyclohex-1-ene-1-carbonyl-CoA dehydrogenase
VDDAALATSGLALSSLAVVGDAVSTAYHAIARAGVQPNDTTIFVGVGGVGGFGVQIARALGAHVIAVDVDEGRLRSVGAHGAAHAILVEEQRPREVRDSVSSHLAAEGRDVRGMKIFEVSGTAAGQTLAFGLIGYGAHLSLVGYTLDQVSVRLSNLMAFDATAQGVWGCPPRLYPAALALVLEGKVTIEPFVEHRPLSTVNDTLRALHERRLTRRPVLVPEESHR